MQQYLKLQDYNFEIKHILEKTNTKVDILSRKDKEENTTKKENKAIYLQEKLFIQELTMTTLENDNKTVTWKKK